MCIICVQFNKNKDILELNQMVRSAKKEPTNIPKEHILAMDMESFFATIEEDYKKDEFDANVAILEGKFKSGEMIVLDSLADDEDDF